MKIECSETEWSFAACWACRGCGGYHIREFSGLQTGDNAGISKNRSVGCEGSLGSAEEKFNGCRCEGQGEIWKKGVVMRQCAA